MLPHLNEVWDGYYSALEQIPERLKKPVPFVVEALPLLKQHGAMVVLDLGCGLGRHCICLAKNDFDVVGVDLSRNALRVTRAQSHMEKTAKVALVHASMTNLPFAGRCLDAVVSVSVIHHSVGKDLERTVQEVHRVLKNGGLFLTNLLSLEDYRYGLGQKIEEGTFRVWEDFEERHFKEIHHFSTREEVSKYLTAFRNVNIDTIQSGVEGRIHRYWKVVAIK